MKGLTFRVLFGTSIILLILSAWYLWDKKSNQSIFTIIPDDAVAIGAFQSYNHFDSSIIDQEIWLEMLLEAKIPDIFQDTSALANQFKNLEFSTSLHITSQNDYHLLFYFPYTNQVASYYDSLLSANTFLERTLFGEMLYENEELTLFVHNEKYLVLSNSPLLVEDVIRKSSKRQTFFYAAKPFPIKAEELAENDNIFINFSQFNKLISVLLKSNNSFAKETLQFPEEGIWSGKKNEGKWRGKVVSNTLQKTLTLPDSSSLLKWIPSSSNFVKHINIGQSIASNNRANQENKILRKTEKELRKKYDFDLSSFYNSLNGEVAFAGLNSSYLLLLKSDNIEETIQFFTTLPRENTQRISSLPLELNEVVINEVQIDNINIILGEWALYFDRFWYCAIADFIILFSDYALIEEYITQLENGNSIIKDASYQNFRTTLPQNTSSYTYRNASNFFKTFETNAKQNWQYLLETYKAASLNERLLSAYTLIDNDSLIFYSEKQFAEQLETTDILNEEDKLIPFRFTLNNGPQLVRNHNDWSWELLMRDRANYLTLVSEQGKKHWALPIKQPIQSKIWQIDRYANGKLQYLFTVNHQVYLIDRLGRVLKNFPLQLPFKQKIKYLTAVDYDGSKNYRILAGDESGDVYMFSKYGTLLKNWNPKRFQSPLATEVRHVRVGKQDFYLVLLENGILHALSPNGKSHYGFPINIGESLGKDYHIQLGIKKTSTLLSFITPRGEKLIFNLNGEFVRRELLPRPKETSSYKIHQSEGNNSSWVVSRSTKQQIEVLDNLGRTIVSFPISERDKPLVQYFDFGGKNRMIVITNTKKGGTSIYNLAGKLIGTLDKNRYPISAIYSGEYKVKIYHSVSNKLAILSLSLI